MRKRSVCPRIPEIHDGSISAEANVTTRYFKLLAVIQLFALTLSANTPNTQRQRKYAKEIRFGFTEVRFNQTCILFLASLTAEAFFDHLERINSDDGVQFRKNGKIIHAFPDTISVTIRARPSQCRLRSMRKEDLKIEMNEMESLKFRAFWERGTQMTKISQVAVSRGSTYASLFYRDWCYTLSIPSEGVPLTEVLKVSVLTEGEKELAVFKAVL